LPLTPRQGFEIPVIDFADDINKHSTLDIRCMNRDGRGYAASFDQHDYRGSNQSYL